jgi:AcrR family transcriptional regulator
MARQDRFAQLMSLAWAIVGEEGADALTLGRLADAAEVTKPVVYSHFPSRAALLVALFEEYDARQAAALDQALGEVQASPEACARAIATAHVDCVLSQGREVAGVVAALEGTRELAEVKQRSDDAYREQCRVALEPFVGAGSLSRPALTAVLGAAEALSAAAAAGTLTRDDASEELAATILATVDRLRR